MKKTLSLVAALAMLSMGFVSCEKEPGKTDTTELKTPVLTADPATLSVSAEGDDASATATTFSWTSAGDAAAYSLEFASANNQKFNDPVVKDAGTALSKAFTVSEIKGIAASLNIPEATEYSFIARVKATADGADPAVSEAVKITVKVVSTVKTLKTPVLTSDKTQVEVDPASTETAVTLSWTSAANDGLVPSYKLYLAFDEQMTDATPIDMPAGYQYIDISHEILGQILAVLQQDVTIYACLEASAEGAETVRSNVVSVLLTQERLPEQLYIYFWAWSDPSNAQQMTKVSDGVFSWTGDCNQWQFVFMLDNVDYWSGYMRQEGAEDYWTMRKSSDPECTFQLNDLGLPAGRYTITANLNTMKVSVEKITVLPERLFVDAWEWGDGTCAVEMTALGDGKFTWTGDIPLWNIKFTTSNASPDDYWTGYFRDPAAGDYWTLKETSEEKMFSVGDIGWQKGTYTINVDLNTLKVDMIPHVWPIGVMSWKWDREGAEEMEYKGDGQFEWIGDMGQGNFKFLSSLTDEYWVGYWRDEESDDYWTVKSVYSNDSQFDISHDSLPGGRYKLSLNINTKKVKVEPAE